MEDTYMKKSFALLLTISLIVLFSFFSLSIVETNMFSTNLNKLKYLHLQANIHLSNITKYIKTHTKEEINTIGLDDDRFDLLIVEKNENNNTKYYISIKSVDDTTVRVLNTIIK